VNLLATIPTEVLDAVVRDAQKYPNGPIKDMRDHIVCWVRNNAHIFGVDPNLTSPQ
jgi:hypothetical protein